MTSSPSFLTRRLLASLVVAVATATHAGDTLSLAGDWRFEIAGTNDTAWTRELPGTIKLPGTMDDAGLGAANTNTPVLDGPYRLHTHAGPAWYQRDIDIPAAWQGKRVTLLLERCRWVTTAWLDDKRIGTQDSLIAPHVHDFGTGLKPGKHRLTLCVDNTVKLDMGKFVSALFGGTWGNMNGIIGRLELAATPPVWIDDVQVYPDVDRNQARVVVRIGNATGQPGKGTLDIGDKRTDGTWDANGGRAEITLDLAGAALWDEFSPKMNEVTVKLGESTKTVRFGMRKFAARGTQFTLNDRPLFLRGTLECSIFPLTGYPPTDVAFWQRICRVIKSYGLNHLRFHSWCPPDAAFEAADAEGIIVQVEGPMANVKAGEVPARDAFIQAELQRIVDTYGNHPSFCLMTLGNEYGGNAPLLTNWVAGLIERDPRHLYSSAAAAQTTENRQWTETHKGRGIQNAATQRDLRTIVAKDPRPILGHEIGQWMYFPDFSEIPKWSGVMALKNFEVIRDDMKRKGLLDLAPRFVDASGKFATLLYKEEIEVLLRTPGYGGFSLLDLHDYPTQGTALVGPLNAFWESKGFITPEAFRRFCNSTVPLLRLPKRTYTTDESLEAAAEVAHFGPVALPDVSPAWALTDDMGRTVASGKLPTLNVDTGKLTQLGTIKAPLDKAAAPGKFTITLSLPGFTNDWNIWIYPADVSPVASTEVVVSDNWNAARGALEAGSTVVFFAGSTNLTASMAGKFTPVFWSPVWFPTQKPNTMGLLCDPAHPLLKGFPNDGHSDWQWFNLMQQSRIFVLDDLPPDLHPIVRVIDNFARNHKLGLVFEGRVGEGRLLVCGINLRTMPENPEAMQLLNGLYDYVGSPAFQPKTPLRRETLDARFTTTPPHTP